jgi:hypothetical protein
MRGAKLLELLLRFGATPKETFVVYPDKTEYAVSFPIHVQDQLANYGLLSLRLLDELDVEPCSVQFAIAKPAQDLWRSNPIESVCGMCLCSILPAVLSTTASGGILLRCFRGKRTNTFLQRDYDANPTT